MRGVLTSLLHSDAILVSNLEVDFENFKLSLVEGMGVNQLIIYNSLSRNCIQQFQLFNIKTIRESTFSDVAFATSLTQPVFKQVKSYF